MSRRKLSAPRRRSPRLRGGENITIDTTEFKPKVSRIINDLYKGEKYAKKRFEVYVAILRALEQSRRV